MTGPRLAPPRVPSGRIPVQPPPELTPSEGSSMLMSMLPMLGSIGAIVMVAVSNTGITGLLTGGMFLMSSLGFVAVNGWRQKAQRTAQVLAARREYIAYLTELRETVRVASKQQRRAANWANPAPSALPYLAEERTRVWERSPSDTDFLYTRIGRNDQPLCVELEAPELPPLAQLDPVAASAAHRFMLTHETQPRLPFAVPLGNFSRVDVTGDDVRVRSLVRAMLTSITALQSPDTVQVVIAAHPSLLTEWEWAKWLPHTYSRVTSDGIGAARMIGSDLEELEQMLSSEVRERPHFTPGGSSAPHIIIVTDGVQAPHSSIAGGDGLEGVTVIDLPTQWGDLERSTAMRIAFTPGDNSSAEVVTVGRASVDIQAEEMSIEEAEATARRLLPLHVASALAEESGSGPTSTEQRELIDLLGLPDVREIDFPSVWRSRPARDRMRVPIGQTTDGAPIVIDIKEAAQQGMGPHGVMIGATGSGKSEVLRTLVLALALTHSPEQLNFVLVDFKGGATFAGMSGMPHVSAVITNLGAELALVDRFQDALQGEVTRRQELLREAGNYVNVREYEKARLGGRTELEPLPALMIVADEFSELLAAKPEFIESFINIGRVGRSLEVHLLLASQRLEEGKLRGLDTFLSYRVGLRTFSAAESRTILGVPDAYTLPQQPGVGYLKSDTETMTQFRAAYVSGPPKRRARRQRAGQGVDTPVETAVELFTAAPVAVHEEATEEPQPELQPTPAEAEDKRSTFDLAIESMSAHGPTAHQVWLPPLETPPTLNQLMPDLAIDPKAGLISPSWRQHGALAVPLGIVDVPLEQRREHLTVSLGGASGHMAVVGGPLSGKSTLTRTTLAALALTHTPQEVQFYVLDFGGGSFAGMRSFPHLAGLATRSEPDVVRRAVSEVTAIMNARETYFRDNGIDSIDTYRQRRAAGTADDGYGDVFLVVDGWGTLRSEFEALEPMVHAIAARGLTFGIHIVLTASRWLEIRSNIKDLVGTRIELRLGDPSDSEVDRKAAGNVSAGAPGRGLNADGLQMLTALPRIDGDTEASTLAQGVDHLIKELTTHYKGPAGPKLRLLPERIDLAQVRELATPNDPTILLGIDEAGLAPFGISPLEEPAFYLYGDAGSGKSSFLRACANEIARLYTPQEAKIFVVDYRRSLLGDLPEEYVGATLGSHEEAESGILELVQFFRSRIPGKDVTPEQLRSRSWWKGAEGFILVDDYDLVATSQGNPLAALAPLLPQAADLGLHIILTRRAGGASRAAYDPIIQRLTDIGSTGIVLSGNPEEGALIGKVKAQPAVPGRAQIVSRDRGLVAAQLAFQPSRFQ